MELTERRREFLEAVEAIYRESGESVHYEEVAARLDVSKWTAYDMIRELTKAGYLKAEYQRLPSVGRSRMTVVPASMGHAWQRKLQELLANTGDLKDKNPKASLQILAEEMEGTSKGIFCAYVIVMSLIILRSVIGSAKILELLSSGLCPQVILATLGGIVLGHLLKGKGDALQKLLSPYLEKYQRYISEVTAEEQKQLISFMEQAILQLNFG